MDKLIEAAEMYRVYFCVARYMMSGGFMANEVRVLIRVPKHIANDFAAHWDEIRAAEGLPPDFMLARADEVERFDASAMAEWLVPLTTAVGPIITGVLGYLVAKRGEIEIGEMKFKNISVSDIKEIITFIDKRGKD